MVSTKTVWFHTKTGWFLHKRGFLSRFLHGFYRPPKTLSDPIRKNCFLTFGAVGVDLDDPSIRITSVNLALQLSRYETIVSI